MDIDINGLVYIHAQVGAALAQANARIAALEAETQALRAQLAGPPSSSTTR